MSIRGQFYVAVSGAAVGLLFVMAFWVIVTPAAEYRDVAIGALVYATGYVLAVLRATRWLSRNPNFVKAEGKGSSQG